MVVDNDVVDKHPSTGMQEGDTNEGLAIVDQLLESIFDEEYKVLPKMTCGIRSFVIRCIFFTTLTSCLL